jgi:ABC-type nitrate/sulfonate/bicarbonate transport system substrate-binding protein
MRIKMKRLLASLLALALLAAPLAAQDISNPQSNASPPWTSYTPAVTPTAGSITTVGAVAGRFQTLPGKTTVMTADITVTTNNTGSGALDITLPNTAGTGFYICTGINNSTHAILVGQIGFSAQTKVTMTTAAGAYPASDGFRMFVTCSYQNT